MNGENYIDFMENFLTVKLKRKTTYKDLPDPEKLPNLLELTGSDSGTLIVTTWCSIKKYTYRDGEITPLAEANGILTRPRPNDIVLIYFVPDEEEVFPCVREHTDPVALQPEWHGIPVEEAPDHQDSSDAGQTTISLSNSASSESPNHLVVDNHVNIGATSNPF
jgi:hypothetical protein